MEPFTATIVLYANTEDEVKAFQQEFYKFVDEKRGEGIAVSANKLTQALKMFGGNKYVNNYLKM